MSFNSLTFALFLPIVFALYWIVGSKRISLQNLLLMVASYVFYGWWDWRFLSLIAISTLVDFTLGRAIEKSTKDRSRWFFLLASLVANLGLLGFFKYYNFFAESLSASLENIGIEVNEFTLNIVLPVGISFYTFQTLSYTIDVYRRKARATNDLIAFAAYVSFFPQLVAGPIERASSFLPQFLSERKFEYEAAVLGLKLILWGLFKKLVVADNAGELADKIFDNFELYPGPILFLGAVYFGFQIYGDFSGYSDIARGTSKLFGFDLMINFRCPYFSRNIAEFWQRWHISLNTWFRDYVYFPLGGSRCSTSKVIRNIFIVFTISGLWHGANWTFVAWGILNAIIFVPLLFWKDNKKKVSTTAQFRDLPFVAINFALVMICWIPFRCVSITQAYQYFVRMTTTPLSMSIPDERGFSPEQLFMAIPFILLLLLLEWFSREKVLPDFSNRVLSHSFQAFLIVMIVLFASDTSPEFIYFQF
jgi:D-alanyl-lipoteichoic acid acyltransferase DltB (MBOAT superfamily)